MLGMNDMHKVKLGVAAMALAAAALTGCGSDPGGGTGDPDPTAKLDTAAKIEGFLDGKAMVMAGDDIPTHPNGIFQDANAGQATQCYHSVEMALSGTNFHVKSALGTLQDAPNAGDVGKCDHESMSTELEFNSTSYLVDNIQGDAECFDFTVTYAGFGQEGRGAITEDRTTLELEIFFKDMASGITIGTAGDAKPFDGDAVQVYRLQ